MNALVSRTATVFASLSLALSILIASAPVQAASVEQTGISTGSTLLDVNDTQLDYRLNDIRNMGADWVRVDFSWAMIQPHDFHTYEWAPYDRLARAASARHIKVLATLAYTPIWARNVRCQAITDSDKCSPRSTEEFARFARAATIRYRGMGLHTWEIWNEPNLTGYWKTSHPSDRAITPEPEAYARLANEAAQQIRLHDSAAFVITGGMAPQFDQQSSAGVRQSDYLARILPKLDRRLFSAVGIHPYSWPKMPTLAEEYNAFYTVDHGSAEYNLRTVMRKAGWGDKQIWATEFGASTKGLRLATSAPIVQGARPDHVTEAAQAEIIRQGVNAWYVKSNVGPLFVHSDSDRWLPARKNEGGFGLRRDDGTKKPSYDAYQASSKSL